MRHRCRVRKLSLAADQRKALLRGLTTSLFLHGEIMTTMPRARALVMEASKVITWAKQGDLHAVRLVAKKIYKAPSGEFVTSRNGKPMPETVLRKIFRVVGPQFKDRKGGYIRILAAPPRRGDNAPMALVQLVND